VKAWSWFIATSLSRKTLCATISQKMEKAVIFIFLYLSNLMYSQTVEELDYKKIIQEIEIEKFTDSVSTSSIFNLNYKPAEVKGYLKGDTLLKTIAIYSDFEKVVYTYYNKLNKQPFYLKIMDISTNILFQEVRVLGYFKFETINTQKLHLKDNEIKIIIESSDFSGAVGFALVDRKALKYNFTGKLVEEVEMTPPCGREAFAIVHKYEVLNTDYPNYNQKYVLLIQPCPQFEGNNFFKKKKIYKIDVATNSGVTFNHVIFNEYDKVDLPIFWVREIKRLKK
jgi:hypothetical protein